MKRTLIALTVAATAVTGAAVQVDDADAQRRYANCRALNADYPHGVGRPGARDRTSGTPVTNFRRSRSLYNANRARDRDRDGIACEKR